MKKQKQHHITEARRPLSIFCVLYVTNSQKDKQKKQMGQQKGCE